MEKEYCHIYKDDGKECVDVYTKREDIFEMFNVKCTKCGRPPISVLHYIFSTNSNFTI